VTAFGSDSFRRTVLLTGDVARDPSPPRRENAFGERTAEMETSASPLTVFQDELGLFEGLSEFVGEFTRFEVSRGLADGARPLTTAGRDADEPAFMSYRLGDGVVLRTGTPEWASQLEEAALSVEIPQVTKRIWRLLASG
jgi:hypothetical protein